MRVLRLDHHEIGERERELGKAMFETIRKHYPKPNEHDKQVCASLCISLAINILAEVFDRELTAPEFSAICEIVVGDIARELDVTPSRN